MRKFYSAQSLIEELGITKPSEIDIESIAFFCGALVKERHLNGCEARILGLDDKAVITVNSTSQEERKRFSIAHELGHWMRDRGKISLDCEKQKMLGRGEENPETRANSFAADLLMPKAMFKRELGQKPIDFQTADILKDVFVTSRLATAIRMIELGPPAALGCYNDKGRLWAFHGPEVPKALRLTERIDSDSEAYGLLFKGKIEAKPASVPAETWIDHPSSRDHEVIEHSVRFRDGQILSLIWWKKEDQLEELDQDVR